MPIRAVSYTHLDVYKRQLIACVTAENAASVAFHKRIGFEQVSHFKNVGCKFGRLLDVVDLQYTL